MTEFALILPVLLLMTVGVFEFGRAFYAYNAIANAARESARYGVINPSDSTTIINRGINAAVGLGLTPSNFTVECIDDDNNVSITFCNANKQSTGYTNRIRVTIGYDFSAVLPLIPSFNMKRAATMRIEAP